MIKIRRKGRNGSQPTSSGYEGPDVMVKDRPGHFFLDEKQTNNQTCLQWTEVPSSVALQRPQ